MNARGHFLRLSRWRGSQNMRNTLLYALMRAGPFALERLPLRGVVRLVGCLAPFVFRRTARRAEKHLSETLPHLDARKTTRRMFVHFAESIWELCQLRR